VRNEKHHHANFFQNWSIQSRDIAICDFPNGRLHHLLFLKSPLFWLTVSRGSRLMSMSIFGKIGQSVAKIVNIFQFFKMAAAAILDF